MADIRFLDVKIPRYAGGRTHPYRDACRWVLTEVTEGRMEVAVDLFARYARQEVRARDILHAAVMRNNGMTEIVSTDRHFDRIDGISRLDPATLMERADQE